MIGGLRNEGFRFRSQRLATFAGGVSREVREGNFVAAGANVDDRPGAALFHVTRGTLRAKEAAFQVRIDDDIPLAFWYFKKRLPDLNSRVIDESIESAKRRKDFLKHRVHVVGISNVSVNGNGTSSLIFQLAGEIVGGNWIDFVIDGDVVSCPSKPRHNDFADAGIRSADEHCRSRSHSKIPH